MRKCIKKFFIGFMSCFEFIDKHYQDQEEQDKIRSYWPNVAEYLNNSFKKIANYE